MANKPTVTAEEFASWQADPVTQWIMAACKQAARECEQGWFDVSWNHGDLDPILRCKLFTYADAMRALADTEYADWLKANGEEIE